jgi:hypothetical protein
MNENELIRRQAFIDEYWQRTLDQKAKQQTLSFHRAPGDPDYPDSSVERRRRLGFWSSGGANE